MTTPELERAARAIYEHTETGVFVATWEECGFDKDYYREQARAVLEALPLAEWKDALRACDCLLTSFSTTGEGPEKPGERIVTLSAVRRACAEIDHILEGK